MNSPTRLISLDTITMADAAGDFHALENVPRRAITMGVGTIMNARKILLMAWGEKKAAIIQKAIEGPITESIPTTFLQEHPDIEIILDNAASEDLTRIKTPWPGPMIVNGTQNSLKRPLSGFVRHWTNPY